MPTSTRQKRLDKIELHLTPKDWAIKLADEMRRHSSEAGFLKAIAKGIYRELPYVKPFYALAEQAEECHSGTKPGDIRAQHQLNRKLRTEFHALKVLIGSVNERIKSKAEANGLRAALKLSTLQVFILQDVFARTAAACDEPEVHQPLLRELPVYSSLETWADYSAMLLMEVAIHKAAVRTIQERYFDGHLIMFRDVEANLKRTYQTVHEAVAIFNEYLNDRAHVRADWAPKNTKIALC
jgi:hypothetical protein